MIEFMRDKQGRLYAVKNGVVIGEITTSDASDSKDEEKRKKNGKGS